MGDPTNMTDAEMATWLDKFADDCTLAQTGRCTALNWDSLDELKDDARMLRAIAARLRAGASLPEKHPMVQCAVPLGNDYRWDAPAHSGGLWISGFEMKTILNDDNEIVGTRVELFRQPPPAVSPSAGKSEQGPGWAGEDGNG